jgi:hypothetical protein
MNERLSGVEETGGESVMLLLISAVHMYSCNSLYSFHGHDPLCSVLLRASPTDIRLSPVACQYFALYLTQCRGKYLNLRGKKCLSQWPHGLKAWVCGRSLAGIAVSNSAGGIKVCFLWVLCVVRIEVFATCRSLVQRSPTECFCVTVTGEPHRGKLGPTMVVEPWKRDEVTGR